VSAGLAKRDGGRWSRAPNTPLEVRQLDPDAPLRLARRWPTAGPRTQSTFHASARPMSSSPRVRTFAGRQAACGEARAEDGSVRAQPRSRDEMSGDGPELVELCLAEVHLGHRTGRAARGLLDEDSAEPLSNLPGGKGGLAGGCRESLTAACPACGGRRRARPTSWPTSTQASFSSALFASYRPQPTSYPSQSGRSHLLLYSSYSTRSTTALLPRWPLRSRPAGSRP
jgi:hypothetical protein